MNELMPDERSDKRNLLADWRFWSFCFGAILPIIILLSAVSRNDFQLGLLTWVVILLLCFYGNDLLRKGHTGRRITAIACVGLMSCLGLLVFLVAVFAE